MFFIVTFNVQKIQYLFVDIISRLTSMEVFDYGASTQLEMRKQFPKISTTWIGDNAIIYNDGAILLWPSVETMYCIGNTRSNIETISKLKPGTIIIIIIIIII